MNRIHSFPVQVTITKDTCGHGFPMLSIVTLTSHFATYNDIAFYHAKFEGKETNVVSEYDFDMPKYNRP